MSRRDFLRLFSGSAATTLLAPGLLSCAASRTSADPFEAGASLRAVAFDLFIIFDPRSVLPVVEELMPGDGPGFVEAWRTPRSG